jgi:hypothetical protein
MLIRTTRIVVWVQSGEVTAGAPVALNRITPEASEQNAAPFDASNLEYPIVERRLDAATW